LAVKLSNLAEQFGGVKSAFQRNGVFLSATIDEPPEEPQPHDPDKSEDDIKFDKRNLCFNIEEPLEERATSIFPGNRLQRTDLNLFQYFLDGSIRTYYLGEQIEGNRAYPVMATEVASAIVQRGDDGLASIALFKRRIALLIPPCPPVSDDTFNELVKIGNSFEHNASKLKLEIIPLKKHERQEGVDLRTSLAGKARSVMHDLEVESAIQIRRSKESWLVVDGAIRQSKFLDLKRTIGLAKSFSRKPVFTVNGKKPRDVVSLLSNLKEGHRTLVFKQKILQDEEDNVKRSIAFWYLRLRGGKGLQSPLQGIVKVDLVVKENHLADKQIQVVNMISKALIGEKYVSPYPTPRWHAHIYPIYVAENYIKSVMYTPMLFRSYFK
jgi:hypothetical protein